MGRDLAERFPQAKATFDAIDDALDTSLSRLMWQGPEDELTLTHNTQPAILAHSAAVLSLVRHRLSGSAAAAGHSLGEYSAHVAAGTLADVDAARLVRRRGELMFAAGQERIHSSVSHQVPMTKSASGRSVWRTWSRATGTSLASRSTCSAMSKAWG